MSSDNNSKINKNDELGLGRAYMLYDHIPECGDFCENDPTVLALTIAATALVAAAAAAFKAAALLQPWLLAVGAALMVAALILFSAAAAVHASRDTEYQDNWADDAPDKINRGIDELSKTKLIFISETKKVKSIEIHPSRLGSGHEGSYKGFESLSFWTNETAD